MRLPLKSSDIFSTAANKASTRLEQSYLEFVKPFVTMIKVNAMLGDGTVTQTDTFDPQHLSSFIHRLDQLMQQKGWENSGLSKSVTEDLHRIFIQFTRSVGKYHLLCYFGLQFHALPYYIVDKRVIEAQRELAQIDQEISEIGVAIASKADKALEEELEKKGLAKIDSDELFTRMFDNDQLVEVLEAKTSIVEKEYPQLEVKRERKKKLLAELNDLTMELYQTSSVLIDYNRLMQGEEGLAAYQEIETITSLKTGKREAYVNTERIAPDKTREIIATFDEVSVCLSDAAKDVG